MMSKFKKEKIQGHMKHGIDTALLGVNIQPDLVIKNAEISAEAVFLCYEVSKSERPKQKFSLTVVSFQLLVPK